MTYFDTQVTALADHYTIRVWQRALRPNESLMVVITTDGESGYYVDLAGVMRPLKNDPSGISFGLTAPQSIIVHIGTYLTEPTARQVAYVVRSGNPRDLAGMNWHEITA